MAINTIKGKPSQLASLGEFLMTNFSRRSFLKTSGAGVAATLGGFATTSMAQTPAQKFDKEADVIVVGLGGAGAATAITAADRYRTSACCNAPF